MRHLWLTLFGCLCLATQAQAALCTLAWNANTEEDLAGYRVYHAVSSRGQTIGSPNASVGLALTATCEQIGVTQDGLTHFIVVTAIDLGGLESGASNEVSVVLPIVEPPPPPPPPPTPPPICVRRNKHGRCTKWGTVPLASASSDLLLIPYVTDAEDEPPTTEKGVPPE